MRTPPAVRSSKAIMFVCDASNHSFSLSLVVSVLVRPHAMAAVHMHATKMNPILFIWVPGEPDVFRTRFREEPLMPGTGGEA